MCFFIFINMPTFCFNPFEKFLRFLFSKSFPLWRSLFVRGVFFVIGGLQRITWLDVALLHTIVSYVWLFAILMNQQIVFFSIAPSLELFGSLLRIGLVFLPWILFILTTFLLSLLILHKIQNDDDHFCNKYGFVVFQCCGHKGITFSLTIKLNLFRSWWIKWKYLHIGCWKLKMLIFLLVMLCGWNNHLLVWVLTELFCFFLYVPWCKIIFLLLAHLVLGDKLFFVVYISFWLVQQNYKPK